LKKEHGGLNGTEDTGYDENLMNAYIMKDAPVGLEPGMDVLVSLEESIDDDTLVYLTLIKDHREHLLAQKISEMQ